MTTKGSTRAFNIIIILIVGGIAIYIAWSLRAYTEPAAAAASTPGASAIIEAAVSNNPESLRTLLKGGDPNARNSVAGPEQGMTALMYAVRAGQLPNVKLLLLAKASVTAQATDGRTALMYAAMGDDDAIARQLIETGAGVDARDEQGVTALMLAAARGNAATLEAILRPGANPELRNKWGDTALLYAARTGSRDKVLMLLNAGASIDAVNQSGQSALWLAFENDPVEPDLIALLLGRGSKFDQPDNVSRVTPLMRAAGRGNAGCVKLLLSAGANPGAKDTDGLTAREWASNRGDESGRAVVAILEAGK